MNQKWMEFKKNLNNEIMIEQEKNINIRIDEFNIFLNNYFDKLIPINSAEYKIIFQQTNKCNIRKPQESLAKCLLRLGYDCKYIENNILVSR